MISSSKDQIQCGLTILSEAPDLLRHIENCIRVACHGPRQNTVLLSNPKQKDIYIYMHINIYIYAQNIEDMI